MTTLEPDAVDTTAAMSPVTEPLPPLAQPGPAARPSMPGPTGALPAVPDATAVFAPVPPALPQTVEITCPSCATVSYFTELGRDAGGFCRQCDYPLFWARAPRPEPGDGAGGDSGLRRLPGTAGRVALATIDCPVCTEPNPVAASICIRCGSELRPAPVVLSPPLPVPAVLPEPAPEPEPPAAPVLWPWYVLSALALLGLVALVLAIIW